MNNLVGLSRNLRKGQTEAENLLWRHLRRKQLEGLRFRRQHPIGKYIVDFICLERDWSWKLMAASMQLRQRKILNEIIGYAQKAIGY